MRREPYHRALVWLRSSATHPFSWAVAALLLVYAAPGVWRPVADPDVWWLVWAGRQLLSGQVPTTNALSWVDAGQPWTLHEPLVAATYAAVGIDGVAWVRAAVLAALALLLWRLSAPRSAWASVLGLCWALPGVSVALSARPMAWGLVLLAATLCVARRRRSGLALCALVLVWTNSHGSFPLGLLVIGLYRPRWVVPAALVTLLNPRGVELHRLVFRYATGDGLDLMQAYLEEWRPLRPTDPASVIQLVTLLAGTFAALSRRRWREIVLAVTGLALALQHGRMVAPAAVLMLPSVAAWLRARVPRRPLPSPVPQLALGLVAAALVTPSPGPVLGPPAASVELRTWSDLELGAWLGVHGVAPFWDARNDCYQTSTLVDGVTLALVQPGWHEVLDRHGIQQVVTRSEPLAQALRDAGWTGGGWPLVLVAPPSDG